MRISPYNKLLLDLWNPIGYDQVLNVKHNIYIVMRTWYVQLRSAIREQHSENFDDETFLI